MRCDKSFRSSAKRTRQQQTITVKCLAISDAARNRFNSDLHVVVRMRACVDVLNSYFNEYEWENRTNSICVLAYDTGIEKKKLDTKVESSHSLFGFDVNEELQAALGRRVARRNGGSTPLCYINEDGVKT